jgi:hypothetical protein
VKTTSSLGGGTGGGGEIQIEIKTTAGATAGDSSSGRQHSTTNRRCVGMVLLCLCPSLSSELAHLLRHGSW